MIHAASADREETFDAVVIGGGPAGSTIGRLLAEWGRSVLILSRPKSVGADLAECLPPSTRKLLRFLGALDPVERAGFYRTSGNTVWWGGNRQRAESYGGPPDAWGYQVLRADFDRLLLELAEKAGAGVERDASVCQVDLETGDGARLEYQASGGARAAVRARFVLDCSGRTGVIARRGLRSGEPHFRTWALVGVWRREGGWGLGDETHTLVETYDDGWAWSVPVSPTVRYFTVMVDLKDASAARRKRLAAIYQAEIDKTVHFRKVLARGALQASPRACNASLYSACRFAGGNFLLVGDAGSFIDPLSSFGVKKALASAWMGAVVVNTCLRRPEMRDAALDLFSNRERQIYASHLRQSARYFREAAERHPHRFWTRRSEAGAVDTPAGYQDEAEWKQEPEVLAALDALKKSPTLRLRRAGDVRIEKKGEIRGREVILEDAVAGPRIPRAIRFWEGVNLPRLVEIAESQTQVPELFDAYNRTEPPTVLPSFLSALAVLLAKGVLKSA